jgi:hypothetical protein
MEFKTYIFIFGDKFCRTAVELLRSIESYFWFVNIFCGYLGGLYER